MRRAICRTMAVALLVAVLFSVSGAGAALAVSYNYTSCGFDQRSGDSGSAVREIQQRLIDLGYLSGSADGVYGSKTKAAVESFQRNNGIHGNSSSYGVATEMTQAVLFSGSAISSYSAPRLSSWSVNYSDPYGVLKGHYITSSSGNYQLKFEMRNDNPSRNLVACVVRYWLVDKKDNHMRYNGYESYQTVITWSSSGVAPGKTSTVTMNIASASNLKSANALHWTITELVYDNGEVYMDYDASTPRTYVLPYYTTYFGWL